MLTANLLVTNLQWGVSSDKVFVFENLGGELLNRLAKI